MLVGGLVDVGVLVAGLVDVGVLVAGLVAVGVLVGGLVDVGVLVGGLVDVGVLVGGLVGVAVFVATKVGVQVAVGVDVASSVGTAIDDHVLAPSATSAGAGGSALSIWLTGSAFWALAGSIGRTAIVLAEGRTASTMKKVIKVRTAIKSVVLVRLVFIASSFLVTWCCSPPISFIAYQE